MEYAVEPLFSTKEVADLVGCSHLLIRRWISRGSLPYVELGKWNYVRLKDLETLLKTGRPPNQIDRRRSTYSQLSGNSPAELRTMLWTRYVYSMRKEEDRRRVIGDTNTEYPTFLEWIQRGGGETRRALRKIESQLKGVELSTFLESLEDKAYNT